MVSHKHLRGTSLGTQLPLRPSLQWLLVYWLHQFWLISFSLLQGRGKKDPQFYRPEGNRADWCVRLSSPHILIFFLKRTIKSLWAAFMWNLFFSLLCGPKKKKWEIEDLKLKHLMPSVKQLENSVLGSSCPVSNAVEEESWICYSTRCALQRKRFKSSALAFFTAAFCCTTAIGQSPPFFQVSKAKICPSCRKIYSDLSQSCGGVRPWVGQSAIRICINPHYRTNNYPCDNLERWFLHLVSHSSPSVSRVISLGRVF